MDTKSLIKEYVYSKVPDKIKLLDDQNFIDKGYIDSSGIIEFILYIENVFKIKIEDDEILPGNFESINIIVDFIEKKLEKK